jgi:hypothetical protein
MFGSLPDRLFHQFMSEGLIAQACDYELSRLRPLNPYSRAHDWHNPAALRRDSDNPAKIRWGG